MMQLSILLVILMSFYLPPEFQIKEVRELFYKASESRKVADVFKTKMIDVKEDKPVLLGYKGMAELLLANYSYNPVNKIAYFNRGKELLERSIELAPENSELRFLRFSVQTNAPQFLGYRSKIEVDKKMILEYLKPPIHDEDLEKRMRVFMLASSYCTEQEKKLIK